MMNASVERKDYLVHMWRRCFAERAAMASMITVNLSKSAARVAGGCCIQLFRHTRPDAIREALQETPAQSHRWNHRWMPKLILHSSAPAPHQLRTPLVSHGARPFGSKDSFRIQSARPVSSGGARPDGGVELLLGQGIPRSVSVKEARRMFRCEGSSQPCDLSAPASKAHGAFERRARRTELCTIPVIARSQRPTPPQGRLEPVRLRPGDR